MSNSPLIDYEALSPNHSGKRKHKIDTITIHCVVGQVSVERLGEIFSKKERQASCNYGIGADGRIALIVDEGNRSWCTSSSENDNRAITIEVASDTKSPYAVNDKAYASLIKLCADICKRNKIEKLVWSTNKSNRVNHKNGCNMTVHRDYANKSCPGKYLYDRHGKIAKEVNALLNAEKKAAEKKTEFKPYKAKVTAKTLNVRANAGATYKVMAIVKKNEVFTIIDEKKVGLTKWGKLKSGIGWISLSYVKKV